MPYFAYGSNLNADDLEQWCGDKDLPYPLGYCFGRAWLPDHQLAFEGFSAARKGAVANVIPRRGYAVPGAMFKVMKRCWRVLSLKEGAPTQYQKFNTCALVESSNGSTEPMDCTTYAMPIADSIHGPSTEYLQAVAAGYLAHGLPMEYFLYALKGLERPLPVFVYGTLKQGGRLHSNMEGFAFMGNASISGTLLNCGSYPGFIETEGDERIQGELYQVDDWDEDCEILMGNLDRIEGFSGFGRRNLYERRIALAKDAEGRDVPCWAYRWMRGENLPIVKDGIWRV